MIDKRLQRAAGWTHAACSMRLGGMGVFMLLLASMFHVLLHLGLVVHLQEAVTGAALKDELNKGGDCTTRNGRHAIHINANGHKSKMSRCSRSVAACLCLCLGT